MHVKFPSEPFWTKVLESPASLRSNTFRRRYIMAIAKVFFHEQVVAQKLGHGTV